MDLPAEDSLRWIVRSYANLRSVLKDAIGTPRLVQPTAEFFPDEFRRDGPSVARFFERMVAHSPLADDLPVQIAFLEAEGDGGGGCGSPACESAEGPRARAVEDLGDAYRIFVSTADVGSADMLAASLARSVGALVLREGGVHDEGDTPGTSEIAAVACGLGVLVANGAAVWAKSCGGLRMARATSLSVEEVAVALALFVAVHGDSASNARAHLPATQREALEHAFAWIDSNPLLVETLRDHPSLLVRGELDFEPVRGALGRWLHRRKIAKELRAAPVAASAPALSDEKRRRLAEARALVDEVFGEE